MGALLCQENSGQRCPSSSLPSLNNSEYSMMRKQSSTSSPPQQKTFSFDDIWFDSQFESGNLFHVRQGGLNQFSLWISADCAQTQYETKHRAWFYFRVKNVDLTGEPTRTILFKIKNMNKHKYQAYHDGMVPVYSAASNGHKWQYLPSPLKDYKIVKGKLEISFEYTFTTTDAQDDTFFAFSFPYTYTQCNNFINQLEGIYADDPDIYFQRELLTYSLEGRNIDLLTITAQEPSMFTSQSLPEVEPRLENLFPAQALHETAESDNDENHKCGKRPYVFRKKQYILISCRAHPCETPASYMLEGLLKSLLNKNDAMSRILLQNFVFVIMPMMNPDGVFKGHYRCDSKGNDLDRVYHLAHTNRKLYPSVFALLKVAMSFSERKRLVTYLDLHAHSTKTSGFIVGNYQDDILAKTDTRLFATVYDIYSKYFDINGCNFGRLKEKSSDSKKDDDGKTVIGKVTGLVHSYKLETGYYKSSKNPARYSHQNKEKEVSEGNERLDPAKFEEIGAGIRHVLLEVFAEHPMSLIHQTWYGNVQNMRNVIYEDLLPDRKEAQQQQEEEASESFIDDNDDEI